jgi:hypothetical protein
METGVGKGSVWLCDGGNGMEYVEGNGSVGWEGLGMEFGHLYVGALMIPLKRQYNMAWPAWRCGTFRSDFEMFAR